jgi:hypothetical protein
MATVSSNVNSIFLACIVPLLVGVGFAAWKAATARLSKLHLQRAAAGFYCGSPATRARPSCNTLAGSGLRDARGDASTFSAAKKSHNILYISAADSYKRRPINKEEKERQANVA